LLSVGKELQMISVDAWRVYEGFFMSDLPDYLDNSTKEEVQRGIATYRKNRRVLDLEDFDPLRIGISLDD